MYIISPYPLLFLRHSQPWLGLLHPDLNPDPFHRCRINIHDPKDLLPKDAGGLFWLGEGGRQQRVRDVLWYKRWNVAECDGGNFLSYISNKNLISQVQDRNPAYETTSNSTSALCGYPIGKMEIRDSSQISTTAPIFQQYNYFRQNLEENVTFTFYFFSFASNFPCKICDGQIHAWKNIGKYLYILNIKIHNEGLPP